MFFFPWANLHIKFFERVIQNTSRRAARKENSMWSLAKLFQTNSSKSVCPAIYWNLKLSPHLMASQFSKSRIKKKKTKTTTPMHSALKSLCKSHQHNTHLSNCKKASITKEGHLLRFYLFLFEVTVITFLCVSPQFFNNSSNLYHQYNILIHQILTYQYNKCTCSLLEHFSRCYWRSLAKLADQLAHHILILSSR